MSNLSDISHVIYLDDGREIPHKAEFSDDGYFVTVSGNEYHF
jgi:hypothetical protein